MSLWWKLTLTLIHTAEPAGSAKYSVGILQAQKPTKNDQGVQLCAASVEGLRRASRFDQRLEVRNDEVAAFQKRFHLDGKQPFRE